MLTVARNLGSKSEERGKRGHVYTRTHPPIHAIRAVLVEGRGAALNDVFPGGHNYLCAEYVCLSNAHKPFYAFVRLCVHRNYPRVVFRGFWSITIRKT